MEANEDLNLCSEDFDPLKALSSADTVVPVPEAPVYNNLSQFLSVVKSRGKSNQTDEVRTIVHSQMLDCSVCR